MPVLSIACLKISLPPLLTALPGWLSLFQLLCSCPPAASAHTVVPSPATYTLTDLGTLPDTNPTDPTYGYAISASGDVAGSAHLRVISKCMLPFSGRIWCGIWELFQPLS